MRLCCPCPVWPALRDKPWIQPMEFVELEFGDGAPSRTLKNGATGHSRQAGGHPRGVEIRRSLAAPGIPRSVSGYHFRRRASEERMDTPGITQNPSSSSPSVDPIVGTVQLGIPPGGPIVSEHHEIGDAKIEGIMLQISAEYLGTASLTDRSDLGKAEE